MGERGKGERKRETWGKDGKVKEGGNGQEGVEMNWERYGKEGNVRERGKAERKMSERGKGEGKRESGERCGNGLRKV